MQSRSRPASACSTTCPSCRATCSGRRSKRARWPTHGTCRRRPHRSSGLGRSSSPVTNAGQRLVFDRNPHYFRKAPDGATLPYLDQLTVEIVPDQNAELLRLEAGQIDMTMSEMAPEAYAPLKRAADEGRVKLVGPRSRATTRTACGSTSSRARLATTRARSGCSATSCGRRFRWRSTAQLFARHGVPGRGGAGLGTDYRRQQEMVLGGAAADAARSRGRPRQLLVA